MRREIQTDQHETTGWKGAAETQVAIDHGDRDDERDDAEYSRPAREEPEHEAAADEGLYVDRQRREDRGTREIVLAQEGRELAHPFGRGHVVPDAPDQEKADEHAQQQQREVAE